MGYCDFNQFFGTDTCTCRSWVLSYIVIMNQILVMIRLVRFEIKIHVEVWDIVILISSLANLMHSCHYFSKKLHTLIPFFFFF